MRTMISRIFLIVYAVLLALTPLVLSTPRGMILWYAVLAACALPALALGSGRERIAGGAAFGVALILLALAWQSPI